MTVLLLSGSPFFTGLSTSDVVPSLFPVGLATHAYKIDLSKYRRRTLPALRPPQDTETEPGENSLNTEGFWRRTQSDWSLGAGQTFFDNSDSSRRRFLSSKGMYVWERDALSLLNDTALRDAATDTNLKTLPVNGYFYFVEGATLRHTTDPSATSPSWTSVTLSGASAITGITTDGSFVYVADGTQIFKSTVGSSTSSQLTTDDTDGVWFANGRLFSSHDNVLYEVAFGGTRAAVHTHSNTSFVWASVTGAPNGVYAAGNSGDRAETYYLGIDTTDGSLLPAVHAMPFPPGETIRCLTNYGDLVLVGSSKGFRVAIIESSNGLSHGPLVEISGGVNAIDMQGQFAWFTWTNYDGTSSGLGRINLAEFTEPLVPAYASDLMATVQGSSQSVSTFAGKRYFAVSAAGLYGEATTKVASGTILGGWVRFSTVEKKVVSSIDLRHDALAGTVTATVEADSGSETNPVQSAAVGSLSPSAPLTLGQFSAEMFRVELTLDRDASDTTTGPTLRRWTVRAMATPFRTEEIIVPIIMESRVEVTEGVDHFYNTLDEYQYLKQIEASRSVVRYQEGASTYSVYVEGVEVHPAAWSRNNEFFDGLIFARLLTVETTTS